MTSNYFEIIHAKGHASIQDLGRLNAQHLGFSASGAADEYAFLTANQLISRNLQLDPVKQSSCAAIEITLGQLTLRAQASCTIAITGADCQASINNTVIDNWQCHQLSRGDILAFAMPKSGLHSYLAIKGGFSCQAKQQPWLGSLAQTQNEMPLGFTGNPLTLGSKLYFIAQPASQTPTRQQSVKHDINFYATEQLTLRFMANPLFLKMSARQQQTFFATDYVISADSNRMGYRLKPKAKNITATPAPILSSALRQQCLLSMPVTYGMVQLPANEQPIVLMKERQTMGGYPVLGTVMQTDLFRLSQMRPGANVNFRLINPQQAIQQLLAFYQKFNEL
ncbi:biotin-dependent carboxylase uncharacterized domain-containing protein [Colwellia chukchiensis]|uniref:Biotin-dependent carboxylase uncharacterized domain-containing protein n=1 Tax=Colwellia chukchiensis TaxID=641665 RepID=A0A1H7QM44_9GAMM|nr:biotin-dependent carboxyltransferase family protein [Colwellia chukchiensis]SEL48909.1 biotin-dependent carboxylase uncharacterized domain-containing protein [Colwellia chukchiensis]